VLARFECWSDVRNQRHSFIAAGKYFLRVEFPTALSARNNRPQLQRVREAVELFDRLAVVDNAAFESLLSEFLVHQSERRTGTSLPLRRPHVVWPTWEFQLTGTLLKGGAIESQSAVTWGQLFGCPDDPWETSSEFRAAMEMVKVMALKIRGNRHNFCVSNFWQIHGDAMLLTGSQKLVKELQTTRPKPLSREMNRLFELRAPPVAHLMAVGDKAALMKTWKKPEKRVKVRVRSKIEDAEVLPAVYWDSELLEMTAAFARTDMTTLKLVLSDLTEEDTVLASCRVNTGYLLNALVQRHPLCFAADRSFPAFKRPGKVKAWDVQWSDASGLRFGAVLSAFAEAKLTKTLTLSSTTKDDGIYDDPVYWVWLAYAFWSRGSHSSIQDLTISWINLTEAHVSAVKKVLANNFPEPVEIESTTPSPYGYVDIGKGTSLHFAGPRTGNAAALILAEDYRCRAHYDSSSHNGVADVVVPGYGICKVALVGDTTFVPDTLGFTWIGNGSGIRSLSITLADVENNQVLPKLLKLVGKRLQTLSLDFSCVIDRQLSLDLSAVASACPELKELWLWDWNVLLGDDLEALQTWGIQKLSIHGSEMVDGLGSCLSDSNYRMSRELVELEISAVELEVSPSRIYRHRMILFDEAYITSLIEHKGEILSVMKEKMPKRSKCAMISVVCGRGGNLQAVQYLDSSILSIIFAFAATPQSRFVEVVEHHRRDYVFVH